MTTAELIAHLQGLIATDPSVADLPVYGSDNEYGLYPLSPSQPSPAEPAAYNHYRRDRHIEL